MHSTNISLIPQLTTFAPKLVIFDKDGTLISFHARWGHWVEALVDRIEAEAGLVIRRRFFDLIGYDDTTHEIAPDGVFAVAPLAEFQACAVNCLVSAGLSSARAKAVIAAAWFFPDPVALAQPLTDLPKLFSALQSVKAKIAVATSDDRALTEATLAALGVVPIIDAMICADDGVPIKPAPDMVLHLCQQLDVPPAQTVMVGDNVVDLQMGRAAAVGLTVGVLSGVCSEAELAPYADLVLPSIDELLTIKKFKNHHLRSLS